MLFADILIVQIKHRFTLLILVGVLLIWWAILPFKYYDKLVKRICSYIKKVRLFVLITCFVLDTRSDHPVSRAQFMSPWVKVEWKFVSRGKKGRRLTLVPLWHYFYNLSAWNGLKRYEQMLVSSGRFRIKFILLLYMSFPED